MGDGVTTWDDALNDSGATSPAVPPNTASNPTKRSKLVGWNDLLAHGSAEIAVWILDSTIWSLCYRLVCRVQMWTETAIEGKRTRVVELYGHPSPIGLQKYIDSSGARGVEGIIAYDGMVIKIVVDPLL